MAGERLEHEYSKPQRASPKLGRIFRIWNSHSTTVYLHTCCLLSIAIEEECNLKHGMTEETMIQHFNLNKTFNKMKFLLKLPYTKFIILPKLLTDSLT